MSQTVIMVYRSSPGSTWESVNICGLQCVVLRNGGVVEERAHWWWAALLFVAVLVAYSNKTHIDIIESICDCPVCWARCVSSSTGLNSCRVVLVQSCVARTVTQGVTTRGRDFCCRTMLVFVQRPLSVGWLSQIAFASLHCCTHCGGEKKVDGLILSVGCTSRGKTLITHCYISHDVRKGCFLKSCLAGLPLCE